MFVDIAIFLAVLGVLIFFHELGHFLAAKACGIYCDRFSLGMPPRVWGFRWGDTDYCIGALPIGGYVKMAGQEDVPQSDSEREDPYKDVPREQWFSSKPVWQRAIVVLAGPLMNLVLGIILYGIVAAFGAEVPETKVDSRIGTVMAEAPAARAPLYLITEGNQDIDYSKPDDTGWETGDRIISIDGNPVTSITDVLIEAILSAEDEELHVEIERTTPNGDVLRYISPLKPEMLPGEDHPRFGIAPFSTALVADTIDGMPAQAYGIQAGDIIVRANGKLVDSQTFTRLVEEMTNEETLDLSVQRGEEIINITLQPKRIGRLSGIATLPPVHGHGSTEDQTTPIEVTYTSDEVRAATGLRRKDVIVEVDGKPATPALLRQIEETRAGESIEVKIHRPAVLFGLAQQEREKTLHLAIKPVGAIGIIWGEKMVFHRVPPMQVIPEAFRLGYQALGRTVQTVAMLIVGELSPRDLGGPVMIYQTTAAAARLGYSWLLEITAFITVNLCVINLVPLPVLDGGQIILLAIEGIRRKPLDMKVLERVQQAGLVLIIGLILFVTYNDVFRLVKSIIP